MLQSARQALMFLCCPVIALDIVLLLGGPSLLPSMEETSDWLYSEFEFEENEDCGEEETLAQDARFRVDFLHSGTLLVDADCSINESDCDEAPVSRGPPALC